MRLGHTGKSFDIFLIVTSVIIIDQLSKFFILRNQILFVCNRGAAFGLGENFLIPIISVLSLLVIAYFLFRARGYWQVAGLSLTVGGGVSNLIDRILRGCVVDFINLGFLPNLSWFPSFNAADLAITVGVFLLLARLFDFWEFSS